VELTHVTHAFTFWKGFTEDDQKAMGALWLRTKTWKVRVEKRGVRQVIHAVHAPAPIHADC
jgi:hypothetical protein